MRRQRYAGNIGEGRHDRRDAGLHGGAERRQVDFLQRAVGDIDGSVVAAGHGRAVCDKMLGVRGNAGKTAPLQAANFCRGEERPDQRVLARPLGDAAPARIARYVEHRCEGEIEAGLGGFRRGMARRLLPQSRVERARLSKRNGKDRAKTVHDIEAEEERDAEPGLLQRDALCRLRRFRAKEIEEASNPSRPERLCNVAGDGWSRHRPAGSHHVKLADLLGQRHFLDQIRRHRHAQPSFVSCRPRKSSGPHPMTIQDVDRPTTASRPAAGPAAALFDERLFHQVSVLAGAINRTCGRMTLYLLAISITLVILATAAAQVELNAWNQPFYDAIQRKAFGEFLHQLMIFFIIAGVLLVLNVGQTWINQAMRLKLRELATKDLIENWMTQKRAARISRAGAIGVNPDQRIHEDAHHLTDVSTDLSVGLLQASLLLVSFIGVLWILSRGIVLHFGARELVIPGYMVWAALIYAVSGSLLSWRVGRPLVRLTADRYASEAQLRVSLVRGAEQADGIVLSNGEADERRELTSDLANVLAVTWRAVLASVRLNVVTVGYGWVGLVVPIIVAAPGYFGGQLSFGDLMMAVGAFNQVQQSLRWFIDNTGAIADWRATLLRVMNFRQALLELDHFEAGVERFERTTNTEGRFAFDDLTIMNVRGRTALSEKHVEIKPGERVLVVGEPGAGKSTFFLSIAGIWDWGTGRISLPPVSDIMFLSQRPFVPAGSLREGLTNTDDKHQSSDAELTEALQRVGLGELSGSLDRVERWDSELSVREQQRLGLARLLLNRPKWVVSDEALDLLDDSNRELIRSIFAKELAGTAVLSIGGSSSGDGFYARSVKLLALPAGEPPSANPPEPLKKAS